MRRSFIALFLMVSVSSTLEWAGASRRSTRTVPGEIVVRSSRLFESSLVKSAAPVFFEVLPLSTETSVGKVSDSADLSQLSRFGRLYLLRGDPTVSIEELLAFAERIPGVWRAEPNYVGSLAYVPGDPLYAQTTDHFLCVGIEEAWDVQQGGDSSVTVAVIDSGVDESHVDLGGALHPASFNFVEMNAEVSDDLAHGTRVAGVIGALEGNGEGIAGGAFGAKVLSLDVVDSSGLLTTARTIAAIEYAVEQGARIINLSLTFHAFSQLLQDACEAASQSAVLVASSGNENQGDLPVYPASFDSVLAVGATDMSCNEKAPFSNFNGLEETLVDLVAPGVRVFTTVPGSEYDGAFSSGTSYSAALVSSVAALIQSRYPTQSPQGIRNHLRETAIPLGDWAGSGKVSAKDALEKDFAPKLSVVGVTVDDSTDIDAGNDEDGAWDKGETVLLIIDLRNDGLDVSGLTATLSSPDSDVTVDDGSGAWSAILSGETTSSTNNFTVTASPTADSHDATMTLTFTAKGTTTPDPITFPVRIDNVEKPPTIIISDTTWIASKTYLIQSNTVVLPGATLTIEPGTILRFGRQGQLEIRGGIIAEGTEEAKIVFTSKHGMTGGGFDPEIRLQEGNRPFSVAVGDPDNDGDMDIVVSNTGSNDVSLIRWNGTSFDPEVRLQVGASPLSVAVADPDNDGDMDILVANTGSNDLSLIRWNGTSFDSEVRLQVGAQPYSVAVGDPDNDGDMDIVTSIFFDLKSLIHDVFLIRWNGTSFDPEVRLHVGEEPFSVAIGDPDNDGDMDIVTSNSNSNDVSLIRWNGTSFDPDVRLPVGTDPRSVAVGDPDNDGDMDIVVSNFGSNDVSLIRWNGTSFDSEVRLPVGVRPEFVTVGDPDNDGDVDIVAANSINDVSLIRWNGTSFDPEVRLQVGASPLSVAVADPDNDGDMDILTANRDSNDISLIRWNTELALVKAYDGIRIRNTATKASFSHCDFQFAPTTDDSTLAIFSDCLWDRTGEEYSLSTPNGTNPLVRCRVIGNSGGDGIRAGTRELIDCLAVGNVGIGLSGGDVNGCITTDNGGVGISADGNVNGCIASDNGGAGISAIGTVEDSTSLNNAGWGIDSPSNVTGSLSSFNGLGIRGINVTDCVAQGNQGVGIQPSGSAIGCVAFENEGVGIAGNSLTDCVVV